MKFLKILIFCLLSFVLINIWLAQDIDPMNLPAFTQPVTDFSNVLNSGQLAELNQIALDHENNTTNQLVTVIIPNRNWNELFDIWMKIFKDNKFWQKDKNNWILLVISSWEKKIRIVTWYGMEWNYPDIVARDIIEKDIRPYVNSWDFYQWIKNFYTKSISILSNTWNNNTLTDNSIQLSQDNFSIIWIIAWLLAVSHVIMLIICALVVIIWWIVTWNYTLITLFLFIALFWFVILTIIFRKRYRDFFTNVNSWWNWWDYDSWSWWSFDSWGDSWGWSWWWWDSGGWGAGD